MLALVHRQNITQTTSFPKTKITAANSFRLKILHNCWQTHPYCRALSMYSCCSIMTDSAAATSIMFLPDGKYWQVHLRTAQRAECWLICDLSYCAVFVRIDVRRACSSVRAEGTLVVTQSVPFGGLLTGFGWGISGLISSRAWNRWTRTQLMVRKFSAHEIKNIVFQLWRNLSWKTTKVLYVFVF